MMLALFLAQTDVFVEGQDGYRSFRIPALIATPKGTLLAFCEGRKHGRSDAGDIDLVIKRSTDGGKTWGPLQVLFDVGDDTIGNPCPVVERESGVIWLPLTKNLGGEDEKTIREGLSKVGGRTVWISKSADDGASWSELKEITASVKKNEWTWYATGPGCGIQLKSGRLLIPCDHTELGTRVNRSHAIYSDDRGETWKIGGVLGEKTNECQAVELKDGSVLLNMRSYHGKNLRAIATSRDGGLSFSEVTLDEGLPEPVCQAALIRSGDRLVFSNPPGRRRAGLTVKVSSDEGKTWRAGKLLHQGLSAYSSLVSFPDGSIGCLYECGEKSAYEKISFQRVSID